MSRLKKLAMHVRPWIFPALFLFLVACQSARTQSSSEPQVIVVPPDEMTKPPGAATTSTVKQPTAAISPTEQASLTKPVAPSVPATGKASYNSCNVDGPYIAMTFDDGPSATLTPKLLDMLKERGIKATFFVIGQNAHEYPDIVKRIVDEGHEIANHSWSHPALSKLGASSVESQLLRTNEAIEKASGVKPTLMRPPYGATNSGLNRRIHDQYGMKVILWSVDPLDWKYRSSTRVYNEIIQNTGPGAIILAHDIHPSTVGAMPDVFDTLLSKGYKFVTVSELIAMDKPEELVKKEAKKPASAESVPSPEPSR